MAPVVIMVGMRLKLKKIKKELGNKGFSLFEILVVLVIFSVIAVLSTQSIFNTLRNSRKAEETAKVRTNLEYAAAIMERNLRNSLDFDCNDATATKVVYTDEFNNDDVFFECIQPADGIGYIASGSADIDNPQLTVRLTNDTVDVDCSSVFAYVPTCPIPPTQVNIFLNASGVNAVGAEGANITLQTQITLRNQ